ncbi:hypothetical protein DITRI_Ditri14bG0123300 [Diplodiscus trichospermus]
MSSSTRAWIAAASIGAVEALKEYQGICRWNYGFRSIQQHAKASQAKKISVPSSSAAAAALSKKLMGDDENMTKSDESLRTVMYLGCWVLIN